MTTPLGELSREQLLDQLQTLDRTRAALEAERIRILARYNELSAREGKQAARSAPEEIALALNVSRDYAAAQLQLAVDLSERLPTTLNALSEGSIDFAKARALVDATAALSVENAHEVEQRVLPKAADKTLTQLKSSLRYHRDRVDPEAAEQRRRLVREQRRVSYHHVEDGAGVLSVCGPGERMYVAWLVLDTLARQAKAAGDERTLDQLRHDVLLDMILGKFDSRTQVQVYLHVPATTLAGASQDPGILAGYGPVTAQACRELAAGSALWRRVFTDPITGTVKDVDRRTYRPPDGLAEFIRVRDHTCVAPGCTKSAHRCQVDHTVDWVEGGCTCADNLGPLCWRHHRLKHLCGWTLHQPQPGRFLWTSPLGQHHERIPTSVFNI